MTEKELLKKSGFYTSFILFFVSLFWFLFSIQISFGGYTGGPASGIDAGINSRSTSQANWQVGSSGVYVLRLGIENVTGSGSAGYMTGTNTYYPRIEWTPTLGTFNFVGTGSYPVTLQMNGIAVLSAGSVSGKIDAVGGTGTTNVFTDTTLAGLGTITASFGANGLLISPAEYSSVNNATGELQGQINTKQDSIGQVPLGSAAGSVTVALGSQSVNAMSDVNIALGNTGDFVKIVGGQLVAGSSSVSVTFPEVTGSATGSQLPLSLAGMTFTGNTNFPSGIWNSSGNVAIGTTTTPTTALSFGNNMAISVATGDEADNSSLGISGGGVVGYGRGGNIQVFGNESPGNNGVVVIEAGNDSDPYPSSGVIQFKTATAVQVTIQYDGKVGFGTPTPSTQFHTTGGVRFATFGAGTVQTAADGVLSVSSDERLKDIQGTFTAGISKIMGIAPILYKYNTKSGLEIENVYAGFSAQNVMQYIPEAVGKDAAGYYTFNDRPIVAALVNSVKELQKEIEELQKTNNIALKGYKAIPITNKTKIIKTKEIKLEKIEIGLGEETHEYIEEGFEDNFWEVAAINSLENVAVYEEKRVIDTENIIPEWEIQGTSTVLVQKTVYSFRTEKIQTGTKTVTRQGIEFNKWNNKFYRKTQVPKMVYRMKSGYEFRDGKFYREETLEEAKARRIANGID